MSAPQSRPDETTKPAARMRKAERKRQLLTQAKQLFVSRGYQHTTTKDIAEAAGVTEPVLYRHFDSKEALFLEVLREVREATVNRWNTETAQLTDPLTKLHVIVDLYLGTTREHAIEFRIMHRTLIECNHEAVRALLRDFYLESEALLSRIISEGQQTGVFRRQLDPRVGAWELIRTALGYTLTLPLNLPLYEDPDYLQRAVECMMHCLLKTDV